MVLYHAIECDGSLTPRTKVGENIKNRSVFEQTFENSTKAADNPPREREPNAN